MKIKLLVIAIIAVFAWGNSPGQALSDSLAYSSAYAFYKNEISTQSEIYNGEDYNEPFAYRGSAYFMDNNLMTPGTVVYNGNKYPNELLNYDAYNDFLIGYNPIANSKFVLKPYKVSRFELRGHQFIRITPALNSTIAEGYYEELYGGNTKVLAKRFKTRSEMVKLEGILPIYEDKTDVYLFKNNTYYRVKSQGDIKKLLKDKEDKINSYIKIKGLNFKQDKEKSFAMVAAYYDQISNVQ